MTTQPTCIDTTFRHLRDLRRAGARAAAIRDGWLATIREIDDADVCARLAEAYPHGWPSCSCTQGCADPATTIESDGGGLSCAGCCDYTTDDDGAVLCGYCDVDRVETVTETCGAGGQTRTYLRPVPPPMPTPDPGGTWACYWETAGDDGHVVSRHTTEAEARDAVAAHDWPRPGDHTRYLCGYIVCPVDADGRRISIEEE